jgi:DNA-binding IclR family transcriptional regulator
MGTEDLLELLLHLDEMHYPSTQRGIYYAMKENPSHKGVSRATIRRVLNELVERGYAEEDDRTRYRLTEEGRKMAEKYPLDVPE